MVAPRNAEGKGEAGGFRQPYKDSYLLTEGVNLHTQHYGHIVTVQSVLHHA